ncbi:MAG: carbohydrate kinase [Sedimentisphaerales bacterium]|nr:carbohydrate kinase [Sedimentisphaerales bacterium]
MPIEHKPIIVGIGEILWDMLPSGRKLGGAPANFSYHVRSLGADGIPVSCIADDEPGREIIEHLGRLNLPTDYIAIDADHPTGMVTVQFDACNAPSYTIHEPAAWDYISFSPKLEKLAQKADALCFGVLAQRCSVSRATIQRFVRTAGANCLKICDINLRSPFFNKALVHESLQLATILKLNDEELPQLAQMLDCSRDEDGFLGDMCERYQLSLVALTKGAKGSRLFSPTEDSTLTDVKQDNVVDTVGAGDAFTAAMAVGYLQGLDLKTIHHKAGLLAGYVCCHRGATPKLPAELISRLFPRE